MGDKVFRSGGRRELFRALDADNRKYCAWWQKAFGTSYPTGKRSLKCKGNFQEAVGTYEESKKKHAF